MRIVSGLHKGRPIVAPKGTATRPTSDRAREAIFNIIAHASWAPPMEGARVLDLFAGSGALGLEAMSRGAAFCLFVETEGPPRAAIRENTQTYGLGGATRIHRRSAIALGKRPSNISEPFDLAFMDPPYNKGLVRPCLNNLSEGDWLAAGALVVIETGADEEPELSGWEELETRSYGAAKMWFLRRA